jgi:cell division protein FtsA
MSNITCSLDIWNGYIKWVLFLEDYDEKTSIIAKDMIKTKWYKRGKILDYNELVKTISTVINNLSKKIDAPIDEVIIGISHPDTKIKQLSTHKRLTNIEITEADANSLLQNIEEAAQDLNYEILKIIPVRWIIDDEQVTKSPIGMQWRKLDLTANVFMIPSSIYKDIIKIFDDLEIDILDFIPNIIWWETGSLDAENKDLWCILIDIGANQTSYVIYEEWNNLGYGIIPIGWELSLIHISEPTRPY